MKQPVLSGFEGIASGIYLEGLAVDSERDLVWYSDVIAGGIHALRRDASPLRINAERMWTGGVIANHDGAVLSSGAGGIMWNDPATAASGWLISEIDGVPVNGINEMTPDGEGGIFFGTCDIERIVRGQAPRPTAIYRLTVDRELIPVAEDIGFANGMQYDRERRRFYCNDTFHCTWVFDVGPDLRLSNRRVLAAGEDADGMALDAEGNVWITGFRSGRITRVSPEGMLLPPVETSAQAVTQLRFGGTDMQDIYLTTVPATGGEDLKAGRIPTKKSSVLYRARSAVAGMRMPPVRFRLA